MPAKQPWVLTALGADKMGPSTREGAGGRQPEPPSPAPSGHWVSRSCLRAVLTLLSPAQQHPSPSPSPRWRGPRQLALTAEWATTCPLGPHIQPSQTIWDPAPSPHPHRLCAAHSPSALVPASSSPQGSFSSESDPGTPRALMVLWTEKLSPPPSRVPGPASHWPRP